MNQELRRKSSAECENMVMISIGKPFDMSRIQIVLAVIIPLTSPCVSAYAQDVFPKLDGAETVAPMPASGVFEAGLFSLNDTAATVKQKISQLDQKKYRIKHQGGQRRSLRQRGVRVDFKYGPSRSEIRTQTGDERYQISYTSALLGSRVQTVMRSLRFEDQVSIESLRRRIFEKYGQPSKEEVWSSSVQLAYQYKDDRLLTADEIGNDVPHSQTCRYTLNDMPITMPEKYNFKSDRSMRWPDCQGGMLIQYRVGDRDDLADLLDVRIWNYQLVNHNLITQDRFLKSALDQAVGDLSGGDAPKL
ncbi:MAG: hypothetical protein ABJQ71_18925 [Roseibium sp.]